MDGDDLRLENHRLIFEYLDRNPGAHLRRISRDIGMHLSTLRYHVDYLEGAGIIVSEDQGNLRVYFVAGRLSLKGKSIAPLLQQKRFRDLILDIMAHRDSTHSEIAERMGLRPSTLSKYLKVLVDRGVVTNSRVGRVSRLRVASEREVVELLITYRRSFWDGFVDNALELYFER